MAGLGGIDPQGSTYRPGVSGGPLWDALGRPGANPLGGLAQRVAATSRLAAPRTPTALPGHVLTALAPRSAAPSLPAAGTRWAPLVERASRTSGVPSGVLLAQIDQESSGDPEARSSAGARGLTQFIPGTAAE